MEEKNELNEPSKINEQSKINKTSKIEHLVISGGGPSCIQSLGAIKELQRLNIIQLENIKSIYVSSAGAITAMFICIYRDLHFDWETIENYIVNRPWQDVFSIDMSLIFESYKSRGLFHTSTIQKVFQPFFDALSIPINITLKDFHDTISPIDLHFFAVELNTFKLMNVSWKTHPNVELFQAIHMTCSIPFIFSPVIVSTLNNNDALNNENENENENEDNQDNQEKCYLDGGLISLYPLKYCLENVADHNTIFGIKNINNTSKTNSIYSKFNLFDYIFEILYKIIDYISLEQNTKYNNILSKNNELICEVKFLSFDYIKNTIYSKETRQELLCEGTEFVKSQFSGP